MGGSRRLKGVTRAHCSYPGLIGDSFLCGTSKQKGPPEDLQDSTEHVIRQTGTRHHYVV